VEHRATSQFWQLCHALQPHIRSSDKQFSLLKGNPQHRSLQFKQIGGRHGEEIYSARVTLSHRALAFKRPYGFCGSGLAATKPMKTSSLKARRAKGPFRSKTAPANNVFADPSARKNDKLSPCRLKA
jgi:hypothetical protein